VPDFEARIIAESNDSAIACDCHASGAKCGSTSQGEALIVEPPGRSGLLAAATALWLLLGRLGLTGAIGR
jgi:hypothetical protein